MHKGFTTILLASTTALAACGGGGGGGGGSVSVAPVYNVLDSSGLNSNIDSVSASISALESSIASIGSISSLVNPSQSDKQLAGTALSSINALESTWSLLQATIAEMETEARISLLRSSDYHQAIAAYRFLTEKVKPLVVKVAEGKGINATDAKDIATESSYNTYVVQKTEDAKIQYEAEAEEIAEENNLVINDDGSITPVVEEEVVEEEVVEEEPVDEEEEAPVEEEETVEEEEDTVEPIVEEPVEEESTPEEDTESEVEEEPVEDETPVEPDETEEVVEEETPVEEEVVEEEAPVEETPVEEEVVEEEAPVEETPVEEEVVEEEAPVEETPVEEEVVEEEAPVEEEVVEDVDESPVVLVDTIVTVGEEYFVRVDKTYHEPVIMGDAWQETTTDERGYTIVTEYQRIRTPEDHYHVYRTDTTTVKQYSDGTEETTVTTTERVWGPNEKLGRETIQSTVISETPPAPEEHFWEDDGVIGEDHADMGTRTPGYVANKSYYETDEYTYLTTDQLSTSNFSTAYSRGWTGNGSLIMIADTGIDMDHTDLDDNIAYTKEFYGDRDTSNSHGTHVAGIAAAERNGSGMHGAAFDAKLAIATVGSGNFYSFSAAKNAAAWGRDLGSVAMNVSAQVNFSRTYTNTLVQTGDGEWYSTHYSYGLLGYNNMKNYAEDWKTALGDEQVLVKAAGNQGYAYSAGWNGLATATDSDGNLILDGQMIIVGNWNGSRNVGNKAGNVCVTFSGGECQDAAKIKDFYIMADGTNITSTSNTGGYTMMTGTSMAAPVVTGSIAVLHQMWPHMKGKHLVQLVLVTGNKNIHGYDENVHGQGILDMDRATRPVGATGIPTTGRTSGGVSEISGGANVNGVGSGEISALTGVMVLDSFERDFYIDLGDMAQSVDTRTASVAEQMGAVDYFAGYLAHDQRVSVPIGNWTVGAGTEEGAYLGNRFEGTLGTTKSSTTVYANYNYKRNKFYAQAGVGVTHVDMENTGMLVSNDTVVSSTATVGYNITDNWGVAVSQPVTVESAKMDYLVPTARTLDGDVVTEMRTVDWRNTEREIDLGTYYSFNVGPAQVDTFAELRTMGGLAKELERRIGAKLKLEF